MKMSFIAIFAIVCLAGCGQPSDPSQMTALSLTGTVSSFNQDLEEGQTSIHIDFEDGTTFRGKSESPFRVKQGKEYLIKYRKPVCREGREYQVLAIIETPEKTQLTSEQHKEMIEKNINKILMEQLKKQQAEISSQKTLVKAEGPSPEAKEPSAKFEEASPDMEQKKLSFENIESVEF